MKLLINGKITEQKKTDIDTGYFYGYGAFETILIKEGVPILARAHLERLNRSLEVLGISKVVQQKDLDRAIGMLRCYNGALKVNVSEGNVVYSLKEVGYTAEQYRDGAVLSVSKVLRNPTSPSVGIKSMNYLDNIVELKKAKKQGMQDVLFTNYNGEICETAVANIFFIKKNQIITPALASGLLPGVVRRWAIKEGNVSEEVIYLTDLETMDSAFITNSLLGIMRVAQIGDHFFLDHPMIHDMTKAYVAMLREEVEA